MFHVRVSANGLGETGGFGFGGIFPAKSCSLFHLDAFGAPASWGQTSWMGTNGHLLDSFFFGGGLFSSTWRLGTKLCK